MFQGFSYIAPCFLEDIYEPKTIINNADISTHIMNGYSGRNIARPIPMKKSTSTLSTQCESDEEMDELL